MAGVGGASKMSTLKIFSRTCPRQVTKTTNLNHGCVTKDLFFITLGVRSLANASRARPFNPLNPPGVGWVNFFIYFLR